MKFYLKIVNNRKFKLAFLLITLLALYVYICAFSYVNAISSDLSNNIFRLHVIANSDSQQDQDLKYKVRDNIIAYLESISTNCYTKDEVILLSTEHIGELKEVAENTVSQNGYSYPISIEIGNFKFPTKSYGDISFPAGFYDALRIKIGSAEGKNWWCVLYPSLCFINVTSGIVPDNSKQELENNLSSEEYNLISNNEDTGLKLKFKLIEYFTQNGIFTAKN